jgi:hypothetical protein
MYEYYMIIYDILFFDIDNDIPVGLDFYLSIDPICSPADVEIRM